MTRAGSRRLHSVDRPRRCALRGDILAHLEAAGMLVLASFDSANFSFVLWATLGMVAFAILGFLIARRVRSWSRETDQAPAHFTLQDLRQMRERGQISDTEYELMRAQVIGAVRGRPQPSSPPTPPPAARREPGE